MPFTERTHAPEPPPAAGGASAAHSDARFRHEAPGQAAAFTLAAEWEDHISAYDSDGEAVELVAERW